MPPKGYCLKKYVRTEEQLYEMMTDLDPRIDAWLGAKMVREYLERAIQEERTKEGL